MKDAVATMGTILDHDVGGRDAVHVAVISVINNSTRMLPGQHIGVRIEDGISEPIADANVEAIGIVDPYLERSVTRGQRFWLYLYPRSITSLRHNWTHPAFPDAVTKSTYSPPSNQLAAREWIRTYAEGFGVTCDDMIAAANNYLDTGEYFIRGGTFESVSLSDEFWTQFERATGRIVEHVDRDNFFSCSC